MQPIDIAIWRSTVTPFGSVSRRTARGTADPELPQSRALALFSAITREVLKMASISNPVISLNFGARLAIP
jgi:hypothetical protein